MQKNAISSSADPRTRRLLTSRFHYLFKIYIEFRSFGGICCGGILTLQKTRFGGPGKQSFWSVLDYGFFTGFSGFWWVFTGFGRFSTGCGEAVSSKTWFCWLKPVFFSQKLAQNQVLIPRHAFFRDLVDVGYMMMISNCGKYLSQPSLGTKISFIYLKSIYIYTEFRSFGGICSGILTLQKTRFGGPGKPSFWSVLDYGFLRAFMGVDEFLQVLDGFLRVVAKLLHQKPGFVD